jgi:hypothetical protein
MSKQLNIALPAANQDAIDTAERRLPDSARRRRMRRELDAISEQQVVPALRGLLDAVRSGELESRAAASRAREALAEPLMRAFMIGREAAGLPDRDITDNEMDVFVTLVEAEVAFFENFMDEIAASESMDPHRRVAMYGGSVHNAFWRGWLVLLPSDGLIEWNMTPAEHCQPWRGFPHNCPQLHIDGPYTKPGFGDNPLPTLPKNGHTPCISNCKCYLAMVQPFESGLNNRVGVEVTAIGGIAVHPRTVEAEGAAARYQALAERHAYRQRMASLEPGAGHDVRARQIRALMDEMAGNVDHRIRLTTTMAEILEPISIAKARGYRYVPRAEFDDDLVLAVAIVVMMNTSDRGTITRVIQEPPTIVLDDEREYRIDELGMNILFVE